MWMLVRKLAHFLFAPKYSKVGYFVHSDCNKHMVCKILNEYGSRDEATHDLVDLVAHKKTEKELLEDFQTKESW